MSGIESNMHEDRIFNPSEQTNGNHVLDAMVTIRWVVKWACFINDPDC